MDKETKIFIFVTVVLLVPLVLYVAISEASKPEPVEDPVKCIRSDIGAVVIMDSTQIQDYRNYFYSASYTCQNSTTTSILRFANEFEDMDRFGPWVVVITRTPDYETEERVFCTSHTTGRESITVSFNNGNRKHTSFKYKDSSGQSASSACIIGQHNLVAEFKAKWKL